MEKRVWCLKRPDNRYPDNQKAVSCLVGLFREAKCSPRVGEVPDSSKRDEVSSGQLSLRGKIIIKSIQS